MMRFGTACEVSLSEGMRRANVPAVRSPGVDAFVVDSCAIDG
jgi:hypothetical protein